LTGEKTEELLGKIHDIYSVMDNYSRLIARGKPDYIDTVSWQMTLCRYQRLKTLVKDLQNSCLS